MRKVIRLPEGHAVNRGLIGLIIEAIHPDADEGIFQACSDLFKQAGKNNYTPQFCRLRANFGVLFIARIEEDIIGVLTTEIWGPVDTAVMNEYLPSNISSDPPALSLLDITVDSGGGVREDHRRQGVATELIQWARAVCRWNEKILYSRIITTSRVPASGETANTSFGLLRRLGFIEIGRLPDWYSSDNPDENSFVCPACGVPCSCEARLMIWERPEND